MIRNVPNKWYTDLMTVYRIQSTTAQTTGIVSQGYTKIYEDVHCRIYSSGISILGRRTSVFTEGGTYKLACAVDFDIKTGDKLVIQRGGVLGHAVHTETYLAGMIQYYYEPFGGVSPKLDHQEIMLDLEDRP